MLFAEKSYFTIEQADSPEELYCFALHIPEKDSAEKHAKKLLQDSKNLDTAGFLALLSQTGWKMILWVFQKAAFPNEQTKEKLIFPLLERKIMKQNADFLIITPKKQGFQEDFALFLESKRSFNLFEQSPNRVFVLEKSPLYELNKKIAAVFSDNFDKNLWKNVLKMTYAVYQWPENFHPFAYEQEDFPDFEPLIAQLSLQLSYEFNQRKATSDVPSEKDQMTCLQYLIFYFRYIHPNKYISTFELMGHLKNAKGKPVSEHYFRSKVIAKLRDAGVLIASSHKGYKLPASQKDLLDFIEHSNTYIEPMISRVLACRKEILEATDGKIDLLADGKFSHLAKMVN